MGAAGLASAMSLAACSPTPANVGHGPLGIEPNARPAGAEITIHNYQFMPAVLDIKAGTTVLVVNDDRVSHTVSAVDNSFNTGPIDEGGGQGVFVVTKPGTYAYVCQLHPYMHGTIVATG